jgi:hypothetical protein
MVYRLGDVVKLRAGRGSTVRVTAPDTTVMLAQAPNGHFSLLLSQPGLWTYEWDGTDAGSASLEVTRQVDGAGEHVEPRTLSGRFSTGSP